MVKRNPFKCNYCGGPLMLYEIFVSEYLFEQLRTVCNTQPGEVFKVQKCKKCGRTYIWAEPPKETDPNKLGIVVHTPDEVLNAVQKGYKEITWVDTGADKQAHDLALEKALAEYKVKLT